MKKIKVFFLDRDGVLIRDTGYIKKINEIKFLKYTFRTLRFIKKEKFKIIVITNQSAVGRGIITIRKLNLINNFIKKKLKKENAKIDDIYFCPHHPVHAKGIYKKKCKCRKPNNLLLLKAINKWNIDIGKSFMIGNSVVDKIAAKKTKVKFFYRSKKNFYKQIKILLKKN